MPNYEGRRARLMELAACALRRRNVLVLILFSALGLFTGAGLQAQDPLEIVRRSVELDWTDYAGVKNYTSTESLGERAEITSSQPS